MDRTTSPRRRRRGVALVRIAVAGAAVTVWLWGLRLDLGGDGYVLGPVGRWPHLFLGVGLLALALLSVPRRPPQRGRRAPRGRGL